MSPQLAAALAAAPYSPEVTPLVEGGTLLVQTHPDTGEKAAVVMYELRPGFVTFLCQGGDHDVALDGVGYLSLAFALSIPFG